MSLKIKRIKPLLVAFAITVAIAVCSVALSHYLLDTTEKTLAFKSWLSANKYSLLFWRLAIITSVYFVWPYYIKFKSNNSNWPQENIKRAINLRYYMVPFLLLIDLILHI